MTVQRVVFHYGVELEGLKYNSPELGELRRRIGTAAKVELTLDPGDLGHIHVLDPQKGTYIGVSAVDQAYAKGLSRWQNKVIRRYARRQLDDRTDLVALAQAKAEIRALVDRDFNLKSTRSRKRHARFLEDYTKAGPSEEVANPPAWDPPQVRVDVFDDDQTLPVFEADLNLPRPPIAPAVTTKDDRVTEGANG
jgi:putative transposase